MQSERTECIDRIEWRLNGRPHKENGPAREWFNGGKSWWFKGYRHRIDGHAIADNYTTCYCLFGTPVFSAQDYKQILCGVNHLRPKHAV